MSDTNYNAILNSIKSERCILILGSEVAKFKNGDDKSSLVKDKVIEWVREQAKNVGNSVKYYEEDEFYLFSGTDHRTIPDSICNFYKSINNENYNIDLYNKLAEIPFHLIISISPDLFILNSMNQYNPKVSEKSWSYIKDDDYPEPTSKYPLIYYLFGNIEDQESLVLTHEKFFKYIGHILNEEGISNKLIKCIQNATYFIFLGIKFDKWYSQLFVRLIDHYLEQGELHQHLKELNQPSPNTTAIYGGNSHQNIFYKEQFGIELINSVDIEKFVNELHLKAKDYNGINLLREKKNLEETISNPDLREALNSSEYERIFDELPDKLNENEKNRVLVLKDRYKSLENLRENEKITKESEETEINKIRSLVKRSINLIDEKYIYKIETNIHKMKDSKLDNDLKIKLNSVRSQWENYLDNLYSGELDEKEIIRRENEITYRLNRLIENL